MKKTFLEKRRMFMSVLSLVAFLFVGMSSVSAQETDVDVLQTRVDKINVDIQTLPDGTAKKVYYTDLVVYYNAIIEDVQQNDVPYVRAAKTNISLMPLGPDGTRISSHIPVANRVAAE